MLGFGASGTSQSVMNVATFMRSKAMFKELGTNGIVDEKGVRFVPDNVV